MLLASLALLGASKLYESRTSCDVAVVGGGPGGIYFAWRLLASGMDKQVCLYERSNRFGGRIYSLREQGPKSDLVVDLGAYRYAPKPFVSLEALSSRSRPICGAVGAQVTCLPLALCSKRANGTSTRRF